MFNILMWIVTLTNSCFVYTLVHISEAMNHFGKSPMPALTLQSLSVSILISLDFIFPTCQARHARKHVFGLRVQEANMLD